MVFMLSNSPKTFLANFTKTDVSFFSLQLVFEKSLTQLSITVAFANLQFMKVSSIIYKNIIFITHK